MSHKRRLIDLTGKKFGRLTVLSRGQNDDKHEATWLCKCECGNKKVIRSFSLRRGDTKSCGCLAKEKRKERKCEKCGQLRKLSEFNGQYGRVCGRCRVPDGTQGKRKSYDNCRNERSEIEPDADDLALRLARMKW